MKKGIFTILFLSITVFVFSQNENKNKEETREREGGIYNYVDTKTAETLILAEEYTDQAKAEAIAEAIKLANVAQANAISRAIALADSAKNEAILQAEQLSDEARQEAIAEATQLANDAIAEAVILANQARDEAIAQATILVNAARAYTDQAKAEAIAEATRLANVAQANAISRAIVLADFAENEAILQAEQLSDAARQEAIAEATQLANDAIAEAVILANQARDQAIAQSTILVNAARAYTDTCFNAIQELSTTVNVVSSGNVGIGTTDPDAKFEVKTDDSHLARFSYTGDFSNPQLDILGLPNKINLRITDYSKRVVGGEGNDLSFSTSTVNDALIIKENGDVGIGITTPSKELDVNGDINFTGNLYKNGTLVSTGDGDSPWTTNGTSIYYNTGKIGVGTSSPSSSLEVRNGVLKLSGHQSYGQFLTNDYARLTIDTEISEGHPFISCMNELGVQFFVHSDGTVKCKKLKTEEVIVDNITLPDYVFDNSYNLRSIDEVEQFIISNKHLPDVPTAKQVAEEGMNLKEMNNILLQKVEELTLYIIRMENRISEIENK
ncbi:MAG: hypothetical protein PF485_09400 [Bacteroidales bacterium]|jgi:hypothetical protein|nr:hypothetical protein [Bacteroidales bacterium]